MTNPIARDHMYRRRSFDADIIEVCVRWYITYRLIPSPSSCRQRLPRS
jgi:transposase-like protein